MDEQPVYLQKRQQEVLRICASLNYSGGAYAHAKERLGISLKTVEMHLTRIYSRLDVHDLFSACYGAYHQGILSLERVLSVEDSANLYFYFKLGKLSPREIDILEAYAEHALLNRDVHRKNIAEGLSISLKTLETHLTNTYRKLDLHNYAQYATAAYAFNTKVS